MGEAEADKRTRRVDAPPQRVLIVDDHALVREGMRSLVEQTRDYVVCGEASGETEALGAVARLSPDILIIDLTLRQGSGLDLIRRVASKFPQVRMLVVSMHDEFVYATRVIEAGAHGYIEKREAPVMIMQALQRVTEGKLFVSHDLAGQILARSIRGPGQDAGIDITDNLSDRELQVLERLGRYQTVREIAEDLSLSIKTIETYRDRLRRKLGIDSSKKLTQVAVEWLRDRDR